MWQLGVRDHILATMSMLFVLLFSFAVADAKGPGQLPNVMVLATGGTIAGTGESSTIVVGYTAATVGIERLLNAVPELKMVANVKGEQVFQIASENMNNDYWLKLAKHVNALLRRVSISIKTILGAPARSAARQTASCRRRLRREAAGSARDAC